ESPLPIYCGTGSRVFLGTSSNIGGMSKSQIWRSPEEIVEIAFQRSSVVMINEAHNGMRRCIRTRQIGQRILPVAHQSGVRHLAMEALFPTFAAQCNNTRRVAAAGQDYLSQPEMREFVQTALDLGWTLIPYEADSLQWLSAKYGVDFQHPANPQRYSTQFQKYQADLISEEFTNWREEQQARNLISALQALPANSQFLVWCGNSHHSKTAHEDWTPMGYCFQQFSKINPFVIDQTRTVKFDFRDNYLETEITSQFSEKLAKYGGIAGLLLEEIPSSLAKCHFERLGVDAVLLSTQNEME
ncbi:MAG TPA: hypothetical protein VN843_16030, partial [Anaerolineales bacterium]|nr:hypothetical protein [Anaerolineales bacterium]